MQVNRILSNQYRIIQKIGSGSFGDTYVVVDTKFPGEPRRVVKHLCPKNNDPQTLKIAKRLFQTEAECLAKLGEDDRIPRLFAYFEENEQFFLVQELIEGQDLTGEFQSGRRWSEEDTVKFLQELLSILSVVHQQGAIHRDIKPANIMRRNRDRQLVLIDFGAVKEILTVDEDGQTHIGSSTIGIGTLSYMPTEQVRGKPGKYSDVYTVGILGIKALTGLASKHLPHDPDKFQEILDEQQIEISPSLKSFLCKAIAYQPKDRFADATEALKALTTPSITDNTSRPEPDSTLILNSFPKKLLLKIVAAIVLVVGGGVYIYQTSNQPDYTQLKTYLENQQWEQADAETNKVILQVAGETSALDADSIDKFPCKSLEKIDDLWTANSDGRFGFTPQKKAYLETGNEFNDRIQSTYEAFGDRLGWRTFGVWSLYGDLKFTDIAPLGHLPSPGRVAAGRKDLRISERGDLLSRFDACGL